jgi:hypothetical protein
VADQRPCFTTSPSHGCLPGTLNLPCPPFRSALRKTKLILAALAQTIEPNAERAPITYYALDLEERELIGTLDQLERSDVGALLKDRIATKGMHGTYDEGLHFVATGGLRGPDDGRKTPNKAAQNGSLARDLHLPVSPGGTVELNAGADVRSRPAPTSTASHAPLHLLFLGSTLGNFDYAGMRAFLRGLPLRAGAGDTLLLGIDHDNAPADIELAYNDPKGYAKAFLMNGLRVAGKTLGDEDLFSEDRWEFVNRYNLAEREYSTYSPLSLFFFSVVRTQADTRHTTAPKSHTP